MKKPESVLIRAVVTILMSISFAVSAIVFLTRTERTGADAVVYPDLSQGEIRTITFTEDLSRFANPERGWYRSYFTDDMWGLDNLYDQGISVIQLKADLGAFLDSKIDEAKLKEIRSAFIQAEMHGLMVIFRAAYDYTGKTSPEPKDIGIIKEHIEQLGDIFLEFEGVLWFVQAGFLGPWGEWHSSYYGDTPSQEARNEVIIALLEAVPESRAIQVRRPMFIRDFAQSQKTDSSLLRRIGYHDDALLGSENDYGTYVDPEYDREDELEWVNEQTKTAPFAGETVLAGELTDPENTVKELDQLNAHTLNIDYHPDVIEKWKQSETGGKNTFKQITDDLGYRFVIEEVQLNTVLSAEDVLEMRLVIRNSGYANLVNSRSVEFILSNGRSEYVFTSDEDPRKWEKEIGIIRIVMKFDIPAKIDEGKWSLYISLPSSSDELSDDPAYSIRFANQNIWDEKTGYNLITDDIWIIAKGP